MTNVPRLATCGSVAETEALGASLARQLAPGDTVLLFGDLGAGKTAFVRGLAGGVGADPEEVSSPTFTLVQEYRGSVLLRHLDLYRLERREDVLDLGIDEMRDGAVLAVEWAERLPERPPDAWAVTIRALDDDTREVRIEAPAAR